MMGMPIKHDVIVLYYTILTNLLFNQYNTKLYIY